MNYRHEFHAGNFADVLKHVVLTRILTYLQHKPTPYRVIETHAGRGTYDLAAAAPGRTREWRDGIGRIDAETMPSEARRLIEPYLALAGPSAADRAPYPGSPAIALEMARPFDRALFCELHPEAAGALKRFVGRDRRAKVLELDGYAGLMAFIPPVERRGLVLLDPPFEDDAEFDRLAAALVAAHRKWQDGILMAWHPIKDRRGVERLAAALADVSGLLRIELRVGMPRRNDRLVATGLFVINPPFTLAEEMNVLMPVLARQLGGADAGWRVAAHPPRSRSQSS